MKILVTGVAGQLGHDVMNELFKRGIDATGSDVAAGYSGIRDGSPVETMPYVSMDITDETKVERVFAEVCPDAVIHCAAWTAVDLAEDEDKRERVFAINERGTANIAKEAGRSNARIMYISTDYVFDGQGEKPWEADCREYAPLNVYGESKLRGEKAVISAAERFFIVRIAWVFGKNGNNFIKTMLNVGKTHDKLKVVCDQIGTPTYTYDLARLLADMIQSEKYGYYHATNEGGFISWYDFAVEIFRQATEMGIGDYSAERLLVEPVTTAEYGISKAVRPLNSRLDKSKLAQAGFRPLPVWQDAVKRYLEEIEG